MPIVATLALAIAAAAAGDASADRRRAPFRYIFLGQSSLHAGRSTALATAIDVVDTDGLRRVMPGATFGNSYPHRRLLAWRGDAAHARYVVLTDADVDSERVADIVEMFDAPVAIVVKGGPVVMMRRATEDDASPYELLVDRTTSTLYDPSDGRVKPVVQVDASAVGVRAKSAATFSAVVANLDALAHSGQAVPITVLAPHPRAHLQPVVRFFAPTFTGSLDATRLDRDLRAFRPYLSNCVAFERSDDPTVEGELTLELDVGEDGVVTDARAFGPPAVAICAIGHSRGLRLTPPVSGTATVTVRMKPRP